MKTKSDSREENSRFWKKINLMAEVAAVFRNAPSEKATYDRALELIQRVVTFDSAVLFLISRNNRRVAQVASYGGGFDATAFCGVEEFQAWMSLQRVTILLSDVDRFRAKVTERNESITLIPLIVDDELIGSVIYITEGRDSFQEKDIKLLTVIGDQIGLSIERLIYQRELERKNSELSIAQQKLKQAQDQIISEEKLSAVRQLAVSVNHEINNPLSVITGNVEYLLYLHKDLDKSIVERLRIIESEAMRIADINRKLLDIQSLVAESYVRDDDNIKMLNLDKSTGN